MTGWRNADTPLGLIWRRAWPLTLLLAAIWVAHALNAALGDPLVDLVGLVPRTGQGLLGIAAMPFLHGGWEHVIANSGPMVVLGGMILALAPSRFWPSTLAIVALSGALIWVFGRPHIHIGASALVFGWFGFLVALGVIERSREAMLGAVLAIAFYGASTLSGLTPSDPRVSWDGHLAGLVAGVAVAWVLRRRQRRLRLLN